MAEGHVGVLGATGAWEAVRGEAVAGGFECPERQEVDPDEDEDPGKPDSKAVFPGHEQTQSLRGGYGAADMVPQTVRGTANHDTASPLFGLLGDDLEADSRL